MEQVDEHFLDVVRNRMTPGRPRDLGPHLTPARALELFDVQLRSRHLDLAARWLRAKGAGWYTIGSAGHEGNAAVAAALRPTDPALPHYRSGAFYLERARQVPGSDPVGDVLLGLVAAADEPIAGGRHKVFGHPDLAVLPQTSTIASHLPRALGVAFAIERAKRIGVGTRWPEDAVVVASFGDASANHSTATGAINAAIQVGYRGLPLPLLLVCEDNGIGISVPTPPGWIAHAYGSRPGLHYVAADGLDLVDAVRGAVAAADWVRTHRRPAFLHLRTVRLMGHAGSDVESAYRRPADIAADLARDPLLGTAQLLVDAGVLTPAEVLDRYESARSEVMARAAAAMGRRPLRSAEEVVAPLAPRRPEQVAAVATRGTGSADPAPLTLAQAINRALRDVLDTHPGALVFGEDVAVKGGVYGVTRGLAATAGRARVFDTLLDEQTILGLALGAGVSGLLPIPEIQYLAYLHNAEDQLRGEAASLQFFSRGAYRNPMVVRIAAYGYQKGFGGHFHNDNAVAVLRDVPGLVIASPARPDDAAAMLRTCAAAAAVDGAVCVYLEPIALYHTRDLHEDGDGGWLAPDPGPEHHVPIGQARTYGAGTDLTIVSWANGLRIALRAAATLAAEGIEARVLDLRWLAPLPVEDLLAAAEATGRVLVVDETRRSGGVSEGVLAELVDAGFTGRVARVTSVDSFVPLGDAARHVLVSETDVIAAAQALVEG
ncbi:2-oxoisovalerate dehydrogenase E1 component [Pseudonocardia thermophila]|uniref:2-oxoisovalerate dehydrogenase E1 component n=1 Tax=Pseudonocardia thermophila TaxID=1848 RepID=A0A1M6NPT0_PSETH|nr:thiamine pyrophosphate-dependent enzyme [Pseudonocardia thermophila]SHJ97729.1 2-oxoisovalerate dehydrogenase E1 component [Pseudonocardia thermophila]